jgi:hypothetical protein
MGINAVRRWFCIYRFRAGGMNKPSCGSSRLPSHDERAFVQRRLALFNPRQGKLPRLAVQVIHQ